VSSNVVSIGLSAAIVSVEGERPSVLVVAHDGAQDALPFGPFDPGQHRTLEQGLRKWVGEQTQFDLGYTEQLYTFGDRGRHLSAKEAEARVVSVGYLALTRQNQVAVRAAADTEWRGWYHYFPWEDWRDSKPAMIDAAILPALRKFVKDAPNAEAGELRRDRARLCFGEGGLAWDEEKVLERYELLYEAGLVQEFFRDSGKAGKPQALGAAMMFDHRRILATAIARLRGKLKYRPVVFELMAPAFTLLELQRTVEALAGLRLHKQNFRRLVAEQGLVEGTGKFSAPARGRPAELFRFRREVLRERPAPGMRLGVRRTKSA
jgi:hypothetical protein